MTRVKDIVKAELTSATAWLSINDIVGRTGRLHSSVSRALRRLWTENAAEKRRMTGDRYGRMQWILPANLKAGFPDAQPPTGTVYKKASPKRKKQSTTIPVTTTSQGDLIVQIEQGVETVVAEWVAAEKTFSAHDVTNELRERVNAGSIQVDPGLAGTAQVAGKTVTKIEHPFVRDAVRQLMDSNRFPDYTREHNASGFYQYVPIAQSQGSTPPAVDPSAPPAASGGTYDGSSSL